MLRGPKHDAIYRPLLFQFLGYHWSLIVDGTKSSSSLSSDNTVQYMTWLNINMDLMSCSSWSFDFSPQLLSYQQNLYNFSLPRWPFLWKSLYMHRELSIICAVSYLPYLPMQWKSWTHSLVPTEIKWTKSVTFIVIIKVSTRSRKYNYYDQQSNYVEKCRKRTIRLLWSSSAFTS